MKFRMAENSLFAVLLRSPAWISLAIAAVLGGVAAALLPAEARWVAPLTGLPFLVIGVMALRRQWGQPSEKQVEQTLQATAAMAWPEFAALLQRAFEAEGYHVQPGRARGVVDFELERAGQRTLVSARRWKSARIGIEALKPLQAARSSADAQHLVFVGLGELTEQARPYAAQHGIALWQGPALARVLRAAGGASV